MIKYGEEKLHELIIEIWEEWKPEEWARAVLTPIYKKGDKLCVTITEV